MEAILRKHIQHLHNVRFIYCGSKKNTMTDMFIDAKKPFYERTSFCYLTKIPVKVYGAFIREKFGTAGKSIDDDSLDYILEWTYYTQRLCNEVFSLSNSKVDRDIVLKAIQTILDSERERFREIRRLITRASVYSFTTKPSRSYGGNGSPGPACPVLSMVPAAYLFRGNPRRSFPGP